MEQFYQLGVGAVVILLSLRMMFLYLRDKKNGISKNGAAGSRSVEFWEIKFQNAIEGNNKTLQEIKNQLTELITVQRERK